MHNEIRRYINKHKDNLVVTVDRRGGIVDRGEPDAVVWIGFNLRGEMKRLVPILIHSGYEINFQDAIKIHYNFGSASPEDDRIVTPIYSTPTARPAESNSARPRFEVQVVTDEDPNVDKVNITGAKNYATRLKEGEKTAQINGEVDYMNRDVICLHLNIRAPGAIFDTDIPFFAESPDDDQFIDVTKKISVPCIILAKQDQSTPPKNTETPFKLPFISN